jgi:hypothetical protein
VTICCGIRQLLAVIWHFSGVHLFLFFKDNAEVKEYIDYIIKWWMSPTSFPDGLPSIWSLFGNKGTFIKEFKGSKLKKKKVLKTRKEIDNNFASKSTWDNYFDKQ